MGGCAKPLSVYIFRKLILFVPGVAPGVILDPYEENLQFRGLHKSGFSDELLGGSFYSSLYCSGNKRKKRKKTNKQTK